jgi:hypothetical protein
MQIFCYSVNELSLNPRKNFPCPFYFTYFYSTHHFLEIKLIKLTLEKNLSKQSRFLVRLHHWYSTIPVKNLNRIKETCYCQVK